MKFLSFILLAGLTTGCTQPRAKEPALPRVAEVKTGCQTQQLAVEARQIAAVTNGPVGAGFELLGRPAPARP